MENLGEWLSTNWLLPIAAGVFVGILIPALTTWLTMWLNHRSASRRHRMELVSEFIRTTAEYQAAFEKDTVEFNKTSDAALEAGKRRVVGYSEHKPPAAASVRSAWRNIIANTRNLDRDPVNRARQLALLHSALAFLNKRAWTFDERHVEHFPDTLSTWIDKGRIDFKRLTDNLAQITE